MVSLNLDHLLDYLKKQKLEPHTQPETKQIYITFKMNNVQFPMFMKVFEETEHLQIVTFIPTSIKKEAYNDLGRLLHLLNQELDLPGFSMSEAAKAVFYRSMLPASNKELDEKVLDSYIAAARVICESFSPVIAAVAQQTATYQEVLKKATAQRKQASKKG